MEAMRAELRSTMAALTKILRLRAYHRRDRRQHEGLQVSKAWVKMLAGVP